MPPISSDKNIIVIVLVGIIVVLLGVLYYNYTSLQERVAKPGVLGTPLPEVKDLRLVQGEITDIAGKILTVKINKLIGPGFDSSKIVSEERKVVVGDKTEIVKLTFPALTLASAPAAVPNVPVQPKLDKISFKDLKKGDFVGAYADKNIVGVKEFTATKIELLPR